MKAHLSMLVMLLITVHINSFSQEYKLESPDGNITVTIQTKNQLSWSLSYNNKIVVEKTLISMKINEKQEFGIDPKVKSQTTLSLNKEITPVVPNKDSKIQDTFNELTIKFKKDYGLVFRAYNDGVAYRFLTEIKGQLDIVQETMNIQFPTNTTSYFPKEASLYSHYERDYIMVNLDSLDQNDFCSLPVMIGLNNKVKLLISEADLYDYPNMFLAGNNDNSLSSVFPKYVLETEPMPGNVDRSENIISEADYIAKTTGTRSLPWRVFVVSDDDRAFIENNLVYQLSRPLELDVTDWIKPGKVAWDWYNANNVYGVDFKSGINNETYKYYIDFASKYGLEYIILDEGWTKSTTEIKESNPEINIQELVEYGNTKNVGLLLWVLWGPLVKDLEGILQQYQGWGVKGVKVDFMQRADQGMVNTYENIVKEAAKRKLLVDFHGAYKPGGLRRAYPNLINYEGLKGAEHNKWSTSITPEHNVTLPFIRMAVGPMDYTPGSMRNGNQQNYKISFQRPMSQGTRCHQVAMYVVYESPLQMLCDSPSAYYQEDETVSFIARIPTVWDETIVLEGKVGDYIIIARRNGDDWYIGAMTDWTSREFEIDLGFLSEGNYSMSIMKDGINADRFAEDYKLEKIEGNRGSNIKINLASGGGWAAIIKKDKP